VLTTLAIVFTDLLYGILIGLAVSTTFILHSNIRRPIRRIMEKHVSGDVLRIELANQVSFLNRAALSRLLQNLDDGQQVLIDATQTDYMDPDVLILIKDFEQQTAPARGISVSLVGFKDITPLEDKIQFVDYTSKDVRDQMTPAQALEYLLEGNERFRNGKQIVRNLGRQVASTASGQFPMAVILSCIDSRTPAELIFDMGLGDIFSVRVAGNVISPQILGSMEYGISQAGSRLLMVVGHTGCGAVTASVQLANQKKTAKEATGCEHIDSIVTEVGPSIDATKLQSFNKLDATQQAQFVDDVASLNVLQTVQSIRRRSKILREL
ncbi:MAG: sulfate transporter, partial [Planctomycetaceae bacterium]|nr:sulfate transporter [Planctomycetaceae bacterium]